MKGRQNGIGLLILLGGLFFLGGLFSETSWRTLRAEYPTGVPSSEGGFSDYRFERPGGGVSEGALGAVAGHRPVNVPRPLEVPPLYAFESPVDENCRQVVLVDSETKRICVYHIHLQGNKSTIEMVASRNFQWDLKLDDFNNIGLLPVQIKEQVMQNDPAGP